MFTSDKVRSIEQLAIDLDKVRDTGKRVVQCHGVFDLLHPGHLRHFRAAKEQGDILVVSLTKDAYVRKGPGRPVFMEDWRAETIAALDVVDYVCLVDASTAVECIRALKPHVYAKGQDYVDPVLDLTGKIVDEASAVREVGGEIFFSDEITFSSSNLLNRFSDLLSLEQKSYLHHIREKYPIQDVISTIKDLRKLRVMIIGDTIIDEYVYCEPLGQSLKSPLVVHRTISEERFGGGALAVANQVAQFCDDVHFVTVVGEHNSHDRYIQSRALPNVSLKCFRRSGTSTVVKRRYVYENVEQKVFEVCDIDDLEPDEELVSELVAYIERYASDCDLVMISDYGHGVLTEPIISEVRHRAKFLAVNAQTNSANLGYNLITKKYSSPNLACVDEAEARLARGDKHEDIHLLSEALASKLDADRLIITRGKQGSVGFDYKEGVTQSPALASQVVDRVGAGDAYYVVASLCSALGVPLDLVSFLGNAIGGLAVQVVGNREPISSVYLQKYAVTILK